MSKEGELCFRHGYQRPYAYGTDQAGSFTGCQTLSQAYAIESQTFVLHATTVITEKGIEIMSTQSGALMSSPGGGASAVFGCDGRFMTKPLSPVEEGVVYADLDFDQAVFARSFLDVCGHYSRPDLLWLGVDTRQRKLVIEQSGQDSAESDQQSPRIEL
jgi:predicted amidohydrolase